MCVEAVGVLLIGSGTALCWMDIRDEVPSPFSDEALLVSLLSHRMVFGPY